MKNANSAQFMRFVLVGIFNTLNGFLLLNLFAFGLGVEPTAANILSILIAMIISFILNLKLVFRRKLDRNTLYVGILFVICTLFSQLVVQQAAFVAAMHVFSRTFVSFSDFYIVNISKALAVGVSVVVTYYLYKHIVFKSQSHEELSQD